MVRTDGNVTVARYAPAICQNPEKPASIASLLLENTPRARPPTWGEAAIVAFADRNVPGAPARRSSATPSDLTRRADQLVYGRVRGGVYGPTQTQKAVPRRLDMESSAGEAAPVRLIACGFR